MPMVRPNPRQVGQAPTGELNVKSAGVGARKRRPSTGDSSDSETRKHSSPSRLRMRNRPPPRRKAARAASSKRPRAEASMRTRSWTTTISCVSAGTGLSPSWSHCLAQARVKPALVNSAVITSHANAVGLVTAKPTTISLPAKLARQRSQAASGPPGLIGRPSAGSNNSAR